MDQERIQHSILKTLLYYDIFSHPLKMDELYTFLPKNTVPKSDIYKAIEKHSASDECKFNIKNGYVYIVPKSENIEMRIEREEFAKKMWKITRYIVHIIKRFPFVRSIMVTGSLSKNCCTKESDLDFMVITQKDRLWISRTLLMLFKKIFLLNSYKYFCVNMFITEDALEIEDKNIFTATEVATVRGVFNAQLMKKFLEKNKWVNDFFPNYTRGDTYLHSAGFKVNNRKSYFQKIIELFFIGKIGNKINKVYKIEDCVTE